VSGSARDEVAIQSAEEERDEGPASDEAAGYRLTRAVGPTFPLSPLRRRC